MEISVIIPTVRGGEGLGRCLGSLLEQSHPPMEIILVVASGREIASWDVFPTKIPIKVIYTSNRLHYARAANAGLSNASGTHLLFLNDDTVCLPGFLAAMTASAREHDPAIHAPRILLADSDGKVENTGHSLFPDGLNWARGRGRPDGSEFDEPCTVGAVSGAAFLVPHPLMRELRGFDAHLDAFGEDADLSLRAVRRGVPLIYVPGARVLHELGSSYGRRSLRKIYLMERNRVRLSVRSLPVSLLPFMPASTLGRWLLLMAASNTRRSWHGFLGLPQALAACAGGVAGWVYFREAWSRRCSDSRQWVVGESGMWRHMLKERVRLHEVFPK